MKKCHEIIVGLNRNHFPCGGRLVVGPRTIGEKKHGFQINLAVLLFFRANSQIASRSYLNRLENFSLQPRISGLQRGESTPQSAGCSLDRQLDFALEGEWKFYGFARTHIGFIAPVQH